MAVRIRLSDGVSLIVRATLKDFQAAYQEALRSNALLEVENGNGKTRVVNPQQIVYVEEEDDVDENKATGVRAQPVPS